MYYVLCPKAVLFAATAAVIYTFSCCPLKIETLDLSLKRNSQHRICCIVWMGK